MLAFRWCNMAFELRMKFTVCKSVFEHQFKVIVVGLIAIVFVMVSFTRTVDHFAFFLELLFWLLGYPAAPTTTPAGLLPPAA